MTPSGSWGRRIRASSSPGGQCASQIRSTVCLGHAGRGVRPYAFGRLPRHTSSIVPSLVGAVLLSWNAHVYRGAEFHPGGALGAVVNDEIPLINGRALRDGVRRWAHSEGYTTRGEADSVTTSARLSEIVNPDQNPSIRHEPRPKQSRLRDLAADYGRVDRHF